MTSAPTHADDNKSESGKDQAEPASTDSDESGYDAPKISMSTSGKSKSKSADIDEVGYDHAEPAGNNLTWAI